MLTHHVHFWLKDKADLPKLLEGLNSLSVIAYIKQIHIGVPAGTNSPMVDNSYDASLLIFFDNMEDHDAYEVAPIHKNFVEAYGNPLCNKVVVHDSMDV